MKIHISENIIKKVESRVENYFIQQVSQKALYFCFFILRIFRVILNFEISSHKCVKVHSLIIRNETSFSRKPAYMKKDYWYNFVYMKYN